MRQLVKILKVLSALRTFRRVLRTGVWLGAVEFRPPPGDIGSGTRQETYRFVPSVDASAWQAVIEGAMHTSGNNPWLIAWLEIDCRERVHIMLGQADIGLMTGPLLEPIRREVIAQRRSGLALHAYLEPELRQGVASARLILFV